MGLAGFLHMKCLAFQCFLKLLNEVTIVFEPQKYRAIVVVGLFWGQIDA